MSIKATLPPDVPTPLDGYLIQSLEDVVSATQGAGTAIPARTAKIHALKPNERDYLRFTVLPPETDIHCSNVDCERVARLLADSRDQDVLPFCKDCAYVEFSHWMVGV
jgi:hypothetical protein